MEDFTQTNDFVWICKVFAYLINGFVILLLVAYPIPIQTQCLHEVLFDIYNINTLNLPLYGVLIII